MTISISFEARDHLPVQTYLTNNQNNINSAQFSIYSPTINALAEKLTTKRNESTTK